MSNVFLSVQNQYENHLANRYKKRMVNLNVIDNEDIYHPYCEKSINHLFSKQNLRGLQSRKHSIFVIDLFNLLPENLLKILIADEFVQS